MRISHVQQFMRSALIISLISGATLCAAVPQLISYQGNLTDIGGTPVDGTVDLTFNFWDDLSAGNLLHTESHTGIVVDNGLFNVMLGSVASFPDTLFDGGDLYLGIRINADPELTPRTQLGSFPWSMVAGRVDGDFISSPSTIVVSGRTDTPPEILIDDDVATPTVDDFIRLSNLSIILVVDRNAGDKDSTEIRADGFRMFHADGTQALSFTPGSVTFEGVPVDFDGTEASFLATTSSELRIRVDPDDRISLGKPADTAPAIAIGTDGFLVIYASDHTDSSVILSSDGLRLKGSTLDLDSASLTVGGDLTVNGNGTFTSGRLTFDGAGSSSSWADGDGIGTDYGAVEITGATTSVVRLTSDTMSIEQDTTRVYTTSSGVTVLAGSRLARVRADGVQISGVGNSLGSLTADDLELIRNGGSEFVRVTADTIQVVNPTGTVRILASGLDVLSGSGNIRANGGTLIVEPGGGGGGGRVILTAPRCVFTDDVGTDSVTIHRTDGLTLVLGASGTRAVYTAGGVQLTGPTAKYFAANPTSISLTRPSTNPAWKVDLDDATDLAYYDLDDDGVRDIRFVHTPSKEVRLHADVGLVCEGPSSLSSCDVSGAATYDSTVTVSGTMTCNGPTSLTSCDVSGAATFDSTVTVSGSMTCSSTLTCRSTVNFDPDGDLIADIRITSSLRPTLSVSSSAVFDCLGDAYFDKPVQIGAGPPPGPGQALLVNGDLAVNGAKLFVQDHPTDPTKEIAYVTLEGPEAGTYCRGSARLNQGVAIIDLPESFALVTNSSGLTAQITPRGPVKSMLYVEAVTPQKLVVKSSNPADIEVKFDFMVNGVRRGFENHQAIRDKRSLASVR